MILRTILLLAAGMAASSCATRQGQVQSAPPPGSEAAVVETDPLACRDRLGRAAGVAGQGLDPRRLGLLSWNVKKGRHASWRHDLARLAADKHLILIQEADIGPELLDAVQPTARWAFAPGYTTKRRTTGVLTLSTAMPLAQCNLQSMEPLLRTPKATAITQFPLENSADTLVVVNIHAVNFSFGMENFRRQIADVRTALAGHTGPIILSGDFNTWRTARLDVVGEVTSELGLVAVGFTDDHRTRVFGLPLDHLFVRGLALESAATRPVRTSDHNPLTAAFSVAGPKGPPL